MNLNIITEIINKGYKPEYVFLLSLVSILFCVYIIITNNPIVSVLFLIGLFVTISIYLMFLGLYFIGLSYLLVYVGAISILFLFILMLINVRTSELLTEGKNSIPLGIITVVCFNFTVNSVVPYCVYIFDIFSKYLTHINQYLFEHLLYIFNTNSLIHFTNKTNDFLIDSVKMTGIGNSTSNTWDTSLIESNHITTIGNILYGDVFIFLIVTGFILLLAMVGTIVITIKRKVSNQTI